MTADIKYGPWKIAASHSELPDGRRDVKPLDDHAYAYREVIEPVRESQAHTMAVSKVGSFAPSLSPTIRDEGWTMGTATTETLDGKPVRIVWEADQ